MKTSDAYLQQTLYQQNAWYVADLYTFAFASGTARWTTADQDIVSGGTTWTPGPVIERGGTRISTGLEIDTFTLSIYPGTTLLNGVGLAAAAVAGSLDGVAVTVQRAFVRTVSNQVQGALVTEFSGDIVEVRPSSTTVELTVKSNLARAQKALPRIYGPQCPFALYDANCGVSPTAYSETRTVASATPSAITCTVQPTKAAVAGWVEVQTGAQTGQRRTIRSVGGSTINLTAPFPAALQAGDTFIIRRGCDKSVGTCRATFSNSARFGGFPAIPQPEAACG